MSRFRCLLPMLALILVIVAGSPAGLSPAAAEPDLPWQNKSSPFGVVATLGNRVRAEDLDAAVALLREAGVQWQREEIFWDRVQKEPGGPMVWTGDGSGFYDYDRAIGAQVSAGIHVLGLLDYNPHWFKGQNPPLDAWIDDWGRFVYATVAHYGRDLGWIKHWELWNEPNLRRSGYESGLYEIKDFVRILEVGQAAARSADPEAQIVMGGMSGLTEALAPFDYDGLAYLDEVGKLGGWQYVDSIAIHPYHATAPEAALQRFGRQVDLRGELQHLDDLLRRYGPKPIWITELGWPTSSIQPGVSEEAQALFLVRAYLLALGHPSVEKIFWYDFRNDTYPDAPYHEPIYNNEFFELHYGLLRRSYPLDANRADLRKPAFVAFRTLTQMLGGLQLEHVPFDGTSPDAPGFYWYRFAGGNRRVDVLWRTSEAVPVLTVACNCREALVRTWSGRLQHLVHPVNGEMTIRPDAPGQPIFIEYDPPLAPDGQMFEATGHTLRGAFLPYWQNNGGLARFGYPLTEELMEPEAGSGRPRMVQYFERARFEHFAEYAGTPAEVQFGSLGRQTLQRYQIDPQTLPKMEHAPPECRAAATGFHLCPPFRAVWEHYEGLSPLGDPISEQFEASNPTTGGAYRVQYFEHARLEYFPELAGTPYEVQFGPLARELFVNFGGMP